MIPAGHQDRSGLHKHHPRLLRVRRRSLALSACAHSRLWDRVSPSMHWAPGPSTPYAGQLINWHTCRLSSLAASTARTSVVAMELLVSAGFGRHCSLLRLHPITAVSTGRHLLSDSSATIAPLPPLIGLRPDPFQGSTELALTHRTWCPLLLEDAADPPDLKTPKSKGEQTQLKVSPVRVLHFSRL